jgi:hypothetical protein
LVLVQEALLHAAVLGIHVVVLEISLSVSSALPVGVSFVVLALTVVLHLRITIIPLPEWFMFNKFPLDMAPMHIDKNTLNMCMLIPETSRVMLLPHILLLELLNSFNQFIISLNKCYHLSLQRYGCFN